MIGVPAGCRLGEQMRRDQCVHCGHDIVHGTAGESGCRRRRDVGARHQAQPPEQEPRPGGKCRVRQVERRPYGRVVVARHRECRQPVVGPQRVHVVGDPPVRVLAEVRGGDAQCQRQMGAQPREFGGGVGFGRHPVRPDHAGEQGARLAGREHVERARMGALAGDEAAEPVPAGHQHEAAAGAGQQWAYLVGAGRVVEQYQHPPVGQQGAVQGGGLVDVGRYPFGGNIERGQEPGEGVDRPHRRPRRVPAQVHVQLSVGEPVAHPVRPVHGERGLADPGCTGDGGDDHGGTVRQQFVEPVEVLRPAGEARLVGW